MKIEDLIQEKLRDIYDDDTIVFDKTRFAGGLTNYNYIMDIKGAEYVIRQPSCMTHLMIDRKIEKTNNNMAIDMGINSECVYFDEDTGIKISKYIKDTKNIGQINPSSISNIEVAVNLMKKVHGNKEKFPNVFCWKEELEKYENIVHGLNGALFSDYSKYKKELLKFIDTNVQETTLVPCHNDTVPENFLIGKDGKGYLIDWEYSGMNDPAWDLAAYIIESRLNDEATEYILKNYYGSLPNSSEILKIKSYMIAQDLLWMVWGLIRHYSGDDFLDYCLMRYNRFKKNISYLIDSPDYSMGDMVK